MEPLKEYRVCQFLILRKHRKTSSVFHLQKKKVHPSKETMKTSVPLSRAEH